MVLILSVWVPLIDSNFLGMIITHTAMVGHLAISKATERETERERRGTV